MDERASQLVSEWLGGLSLDGRRTLYSLLDELFGCTLPELREAVAASLGDDLPLSGRPRSALESLRDEIASRGHPDFREAEGQ